MDINREFWDGNTRKIQDNNNNVIVEFLDSSLYTKINADNEKYIGVDWDKSVCPWKINANSEFFNLSYMLGYNAGYEQLVTVETCPLFKNRSKGFTFYLSSNGKNNISGARSRMFPVWLATLSRTDIDLTDSTVSNWVQDKYKELHPVIKFDYSKIFTVPFLQIKNDGNRVMFSENLRADFNASNYSGWGVAFIYKNGQTPLDLALEIVSLNNKFTIPTWDTTDCFQTEEFDNGFCITSYDVQYSDIYWKAQLGERVQYSGSTGTYFDERNFQTVDASGAVQYYPNRMIYVNGTDNDVYDNRYYGGFISDGKRPFRRTFSALTTFDELCDYFAQELAYLGFRFLIDGSKTNQDINSEYFYIPVIDSKGVTTGEYYQANSQDAQQLNNYQWTDNVYQRTPYDGTDDDDDAEPYDENQETILNPYGNTIYQRFVTQYACLNSDIHSLSDFFYSEVSTNCETSWYSAKTFLTNNPMDTIVNLMFFPFDVMQYSPHEPYTENIQLGVLDSGVSARRVSYNVATIDMGTRKFELPFGANDFRSYAPYTSAELILPFCGSIELNPEIYGGHTITVKYLVDLMTGECKALVFRDKLLVDSVGGSMGIRVPLSGIDSQTLASAEQQAKAQYKTARNATIMKTAGAVTAGVGAITSGSVMLGASAVGSGVSAVNDIEKLHSMKYDLEHVQIPFKTIGTSTSMIEYSTEMCVRIIFKRPVMLPYSGEIYGHSKGYACYYTDSISNFSGYTEITGLDMADIPCTYEEKIRLKTALESGVFLP